MKSAIFWYIALENPSINVEPGRNGVAFRVDSSRRTHLLAFAQSGHIFPCLKSSQWSSWTKCSPWLVKAKREKLMKLWRIKLVCLRINHLKAVMNIPISMIAKQLPEEGHAKMDQRY